MARWGRRTAHSETLPFLPWGPPYPRSGSRVGSWGEPRRPPGPLQGRSCAWTASGCPRGCIVRQGGGGSPEDPEAGEGPSWSGQPQQGAIWLRSPASCPPRSLSPSEAASPLGRQRGGRGLPAAGQTPGTPSGCSPSSIFRPITVHRGVVPPLLPQQNSSGSSRQPRLPELCVGASALPNRREIGELPNKWISRLHRGSKGRGWECHRRSSRPPSSWPTGTGCSPSEGYSRRCAGHVLTRPGARGLVQAAQAGGANTLYLEAV